MKKTLFSLLVATLLVTACAGLNEPFGSPAQPTAVVKPIQAAPVRVSSVNVGNPPFQTVTQQDENGRSVTTLAGFDLNEFGGNDSGCTRTELDSIHIGEVVGSQSEKCLSVIEWSLKVGDETILAGTYALHPGEWFYIPLAVSGENDSPRIVGTLWYLPKGWNSHMYAADIAADRDIRDGTHSYVGLSPTDPWVVGIAESLK